MVKIDEYINIYYNLYEFFGQSDEPIITALLDLMKHSDKLSYINRSIIRDKLSSLSFNKLGVYLEQLSNVPKDELEKYKIDEVKELKLINIHLDMLIDANCKNIDKVALKEVIEKCKILKESH